MLTIGVDSHKRSFTAVAVDSMGRQQATTQVPTTCSGRAHLLDWAEALREGAPLRWGIEGSGSYGRPLAQQLARRGQDVLEVPGIATSRERKAALGVHRQKMDTSDASQSHVSRSARAIACLVSFRTAWRSGARSSRSTVTTLWSNAHA
jgi:transposase